MEDHQIVELYLRREEEAVRQTQEKYGRRLYHLAFGIVGDVQAAQECENDTYFQAWNTIPPHEPRDYLYPFLARLTRHISLNLCRDRERLKRKAVLCARSAELEECIPAPDDAACALEEGELREAINGFLGELGEEQRSIFLRRYWYLDSIQFIAKRYGCSQSKVKTMLFRIRRQMRNYLKKEGYLL